MPINLIRRKLEFELSLSVSVFSRETRKWAKNRYLTIFRSLSVFLDLSRNLELWALEIERKIEFQCQTELLFFFCSMSTSIRINFCCSLSSISTRNKTKFETFQINYEFWRILVETRPRYQNLCKMVLIGFDITREFIRRQSNEAKKKIHSKKTTYSSRKF